MQVTVTTAIFEEAPVRHAIRDAQYWLHLGDVCAILDIKNPRNIAARLREIENGAGICSMDARNARNERRPTNFVLEKYLYFDVIPKSRKPGARRFADWAREVLCKAVRKAANIPPPVPQPVNVGVQLELIKFVKDTWGNDARMLALAKEKAASLMGYGSGIASIEESPLLTVTEALEQKDHLSRAWIQKNRSKIGRKVAAAYRSKNHEFQTTQKVVNGHTVDVKIYKDGPEFQQILKDAMEE